MNNVDLGYSSIANDEMFLRITVEDTGKGIKKED